MLTHVIVINIIKCCPENKRKCASDIVFTVLMSSCNICAPNKPVLYRVLRENFTFK